MDRCPFATWKPISANIYKGGRKTIRGFVPHVQVGTGSLYGFFNTAKPKGKGGSADFWCSKTGALEQYVSMSDQSWAQGSTQHNGNPYFVSCEFEGNPSEPMTPAQLDMGGQLIAWVLSWSSWPLQVNTNPDGSGVTPHHVFGGGHTCPGPGPREGQYPDLILATRRHLPGPGNVPVPPLEVEMLDPADPIVQRILGAAENTAWGVLDPGVGLRKMVADLAGKPVAMPSAAQIAALLPKELAIEVADEIGKRFAGGKS